MKRKIIPMAKREPTDKERHLSELIKKSVEELSKLVKKGGKL